MRKLLISLIVLLSIVMVGLCVLLGFLLSVGRDGKELFFGEYNLVLEKEIAAEEILSLKVDYEKNCNDVFFYQGAEGNDSIVICEYMNFTPEERQISTVEWSGGKLTVKGPRRNVFSLFSFGSRDGYTEIYLPEGFAERLEELQVETVSGDVRSEIAFSVENDFAVSTVSGDVYFPKADGEKTRVSTTSGNVQIAAVNAEQISISTTSGDITLEEAFGETVISTTSGDVKLQEIRGNFDAGSVSGDISADTLEGNFQVNTTSGIVSIGGSGCGRVSSVSGDISIWLAGLDGDLDVSTTSGDVSLQLPKTASFALAFNSTSGACETFFDDMLSFDKRGNKANGQYGGGVNTINVSTVSGDLAIASYKIEGNR